MTKKMNDAKTNTPMDPSAKEVAAPSGVVRRARPCWAIKTLAAEVFDLFPEATYTLDGYDQFNTALEITYDTGSVEDEHLFSALLSCVKGDPRVSAVEYDEDLHQFLVVFRPSARTKDDQTPFGLEDAWLILSEEAGS